MSLTTSSNQGHTRKQAAKNALGTTAKVPQERGLLYHHPQHASPPPHPTTPIPSPHPRQHLVIRHQQVVLDLRLVQIHAALHIHRVQQRLYVGVLLLKRKPHAVAVHQHAEGPLGVLRVGLGDLAQQPHVRQGLGKGWGVGPQVGDALSGKRGAGQCVVGWLDGGRGVALGPQPKHSIARHSIA